jgi:hypothetical protein
VNAVAWLHVEPADISVGRQSNPEWGIWMLRAEHAPQLSVDEQVDGTPKHAVNDTGSRHPRVDLATEGKSG